jgi:hypothetical protein
MKKQILSLTMTAVAIELTTQAEAEQLAALSACIIRQQDELALLVAARCDSDEIRARMEAN